MFSFSNVYFSNFFFSAQINQNEMKNNSFNMKVGKKNQKKGHSSTTIVTILNCFFFFLLIKSNLRLLWFISYFDAYLNIDDAYDINGCSGIFCFIGSIIGSIYDGNSQCYIRCFVDDISVENSIQLLL